METNDLNELMEHGFQINLTKENGYKQQYGMDMKTFIKNIKLLIRQDLHRELEELGHLKATSNSLQESNKLLLNRNTSLENDINSLKAQNGKFIVQISELLEEKKNKTYDLLLGVSAVFYEIEKLINNLNSMGIPDGGEYLFIDIINKYIKENEKIEINDLMKKCNLSDSTQEQVHKTRLETVLIKIGDLHSIDNEGTLGYRIYKESKKTIKDFLYTPEIGDLFDSKIHTDIRNKISKGSIYKMILPGIRLKVDESPEQIIKKAFVITKD